MPIQPVSDRPVCRWSTEGTHEAIAVGGGRAGSGGRRRPGGLGRAGRTGDGGRAALRQVGIEHIRMNHFQARFGGEFLAEVGYQEGIDLDGDDSRGSLQKFFS